MAKQLQLYRNRLLSFLKDKRSKIAFLTVGICSIFAYLYYITNLISNNDMISCTPLGIGESIRSGRWGLFLLSEAVDRLWGGHYNVPAFNVMLALILTSLSAALLIRVLELRKTSLCVCLSALTATVPALASTMFFAYSVQYYTLAILLTVTAAWLVGKKGLPSYLGAVACGCFSLSIYQAYLPFFGVLLLLGLILRCYRQEESPKALLLNAFKYLSVLILSYLCYSLILKLLLRVLGLSLSDYQGINTMGTVHLSGIARALKDVLLLPLRPGYYGFNATVVICLGIGLSYLCVAVTLLWGKRLPLGKGLLLGLFLLCLLVCVNATHILAGDSVLYTRMTLGLVGIFFLPLVLLEHVPFRKEDRKALASGILVTVLLLCCANYAWQSNGNYLSVEYSNRKAENYFSSMFTRIRSAEGYKQELPIVYVGQTISDKAYVDNWILPPFTYTGRMGAKAQLNQYSRNNFIRNYLGLEWRKITEAEAQKYADLIGDLECYPNDHSIAVTEDFVLIRLE